MSYWTSGGGGGGGGWASWTTCSVSALYMYVYLMPNDQTLYFGLPECDLTMD